MGRRSSYDVGSISVGLILLLIVATLSSVSMARPLHIRQITRDNELASQSHSAIVRDEDDGHFYGIPGFFLYPLPSSFYGGASSTSASISSLQIILLTAGTFLVVK